MTEVEADALGDFEVERGRAEAYLAWSSLETASPFLRTKAGRICSWPFSANSLSPQKSRGGFILLPTSSNSWSCSSLCCVGVDVPESRDSRATIDSRVEGAIGRALKREVKCDRIGSDKEGGC